MRKISDEHILDLAKDLAVRQDLLSRGKAERLIGAEKESCRRIPSDGSSRRFWRITDRDTAICIITAPHGSSVPELAEARSAWKIGSHLVKKKAAVPRLFGRDEAVGLVLFEDLGSVSLYDTVTSPDEGISAQPECVEELFCLVIEQLVIMQLGGASGFDTAWCWDTPVYNKALMLEKESRYFLNSFWVGLLGERERPGVDEELHDIADNAGQAPASFLLHRDFQSRNIMIKNGRPFFIDFQGARLGPLGYDLASLLIDPYTQLPEKVQEKLLEHYIACVSNHRHLEKRVFLHEYNMLALQRNLQIIGAYSFLFKEKKKPFFKQFLLPSLVMLQKRLRSGYFSSYKNLRIQIDDSVKLVHSIL